MKHVNVPALTRNSVRAFLLFCCAMLLASSAQALVSTGNKWVRADVEEDGTGLMTFYGYPGTGGNSDYSISFKRKSFLTVLLNQRYFTNNDLGPLPTPNGGLLDDGKTFKIGDTIRTQWVRDGYTITQDCYPMLFTRSGQIIIRVRVKNPTTSVLAAQSQYMLDLDVNGNDHDTVLSRWGFHLQPETFPNANHPIPPFYMGLEHMPPTLGKDATGWLIRPDLGIMTPSTFVIADWRDFITTTWGPPVNTVHTGQPDHAVLMMWPATGVAGGTEKEIGSTSIGNGEFNICNGKIFALVFYPIQLPFDPALKDYDPNPFKVEALLFNTQGASATNVRASLTVGDSLHPMDSAGKNVLYGTQTETHNPSPNFIPAAGVTDMTWFVKAGYPHDCKAGQDWFDSYLQIDVTGNGPIVPPFSGEGCQLPIALQCITLDTLAPGSEKVFGTLNDSSFLVHDSQPIDKGLKSVAWGFSSGSLSDFVITTNPDTIENCPKTNVTVNIHRNDTTKGGCIHFVFTDCVGNVSVKDVCFVPQALFNSIDTLAPEFLSTGRTKWPYISGTLDSTIECHGQCASMNATDIRENDRGLRTVESVTATNMTLSVAPFSVGTKIVPFTACVTDTMLDGSITIRATDTVGHSTETSLSYCTVPDTLKPVLIVSPYVGNRWHVHVTDSAAWDRGLDQIILSNMANVAPSPDPTAMAKGTRVYDFDMNVIDEYADARFCVYAVDVAGNRDILTTHCYSTPPQTDIWAPNIRTSAPVTSNVISMDFEIDDVHMTPRGDTNTFDTGIDSVFFTSVKNMTLIYNGNTYVNDAANPNVTFPTIRNVRNPDPNAHPPFSLKGPSFTIKVSDTAATDPSACVTVHAVDGRQLFDPIQRNETVVGWCYPVVLDTLAPLITGTGATHSGISLNVSDNRPKDRGLGHVWLTGKNFAPLDNSVTNIDNMPLTLQVLNPGKSAVGTLNAVDYFGTQIQSLPDRLLHTSTADVAIYVQNLRLKVSKVILQPEDFDIAIYLDSTDDVPVAQKKLSSLDFNFHLSGSSLINFKSVKTAGTLMSGWNITNQATGASRDTRISIRANGTDYLGGPGQPAPLLTQPLLYLTFHGDSSTDPGVTSIVVDGPIGSEVAFNGGQDQTVTGTNSVVVLPAPYGSLNGGTVTIKGSCSPIITSGAKPSIISMAPASPNPTTTSTTVEYTIPKQGTVRLDLYNSLGVLIKTLVNEEEEQGTYRLNVAASGLAEGTYFLRLESQGKVVSRRVAISH